MGEHWVSALVVLSIAASALGYDNGVAVKPAMGWNTWCTMASCGNPHTGSQPLHDVCNQDEMLEVAAAMLRNGMYALGYDRINADDCWAATGRNAQGELFADPTRFPDGWAAFASRLWALGFKNGLYTSAGSTTCSSGQRPGAVPGSYGHYKQDAATFASWGVDYVKIDWCGGNLTNGTLQHAEFSRAMNATGRPMWLELCRGYPYPPPPSTRQVAQSARVSGDHHDNWGSTASVIEGLGAAAATHLSASPDYWGYGDFLMTGGAGCDINATLHCPGMTDTEYRTEFSIWAITASPLIVATDVRNMTQVMREALLNEELVAVNQDYRGEAGFRIGFDDCPIFTCQIWARNLSDGSVVVALYNADLTVHSMRVDFGQLGKDWAGATLHVRDLWAHADMGTATGSFSATVDSHAATVVRLSAAAQRPLRVRRRALTPAAAQLLAGL